MNTNNEKLTDAQDIANTIERVDVAAFREDNAARTRLLTAARRLCRELETPWERMAQMLWGGVSWPQRHQCCEADTSIALGYLSYEDCCRHGSLQDDTCNG